MGILSVYYMNECLLEEGSKPLVLEFQMVVTPSRGCWDLSPGPLQEHS